MADDAEIQTRDSPTADCIAGAIEVLEQLAADRGLLERLSRDDMHRLMRAAQRVAVPDRISREKLRRAIRNREKTERSRKKAEDELLLGKTGIRRQHSARQLKQPRAPAPFEPQLPPTGKQPDDQFGPRLQVPRCCYICKRDYDRPDSAIAFRSLVPRPAEPRRQTRCVSVTNVH